MQLLIKKWQVAVRGMRLIKQRAIKPKRCVIQLIVFILFSVRFRFTQIRIISRVFAGLQEFTNEIILL